MLEELEGNLAIQRVQVNVFVCLAKGQTRVLAKPFLSYCLTAQGKYGIVT